MTDDDAKQTDDRLARIARFAQAVDSCGGEITKLFAEGNGALMRARPDWRGVEPNADQIALRDAEFDAMCVDLRRSIKQVFERYMSA